MKVYSLRADEGGCSFYRMKEPSRVVQENHGIDITVDIDIAVDATKFIETKTYEVHEVREDIDLLIVQRPLSSSLHSLIVQAKKQGIAVVVELDDDFSCVHPKNRAWRLIQPVTSPHANYEWLYKSAHLADLVTVSTPALSFYGEEGRVEVLPNCVPASIFNVKASPGSVRGIGWTGTIQTHPEDLTVTAGHVARAAYATKTPIRIVGDGVGVAGQLGMKSLDDVQSTGWIPLEGYYQAIADNMSVGIVPLEKSRFNEAKSNLKGLEMAALGIPFVASDTAEYRRLAELGIGQVVHQESDWNTALKKLISSPIKRSKLGKQYQEIVKENLVYEDNSHKWLTAWEKAIDLSKKR